MPFNGFPTWEGINRARAEAEAGEIAGEAITNDPKSVEGRTAGALLLCEKFVPTLRAKEDGTTEKTRLCATCGVERPKNL